MNGSRSNQMTVPGKEIVTGVAKVTRTQLTGVYLKWMKTVVRDRAVCSFASFHYHLQNYKKLPKTRHTHGKKTLKIFRQVVWDVGDVVKDMDLGEQVDEVWHKSESVFLSSDIGY